MNIASRRAGTIAPFMPRANARRSVKQVTRYSERIIANYEDWLSRFDRIAPSRDERNELFTVIRELKRDLADLEGNPPCVAQ